jgi:DNA-binding NarL/FixJ family response regulator
VRGGTYFPPAAIMVRRAGGKTAHLDCRAASETAADGDLEQRNTTSSSVVESSAGQQQTPLLCDKAAQVRARCQDHFGTPSEYLIEMPGSHSEIKTASSQPLTDRQRAVLLCLCRGDPNKVIGRKLGMTETTVKVHVREIMRKLGVVNRTQVAIAVGRNGLFGNGDVLLAGPDTPALSSPRQQNS